MTLETAHCAAHPGVIAVDTCQRCGRFVCGECVTLERDESYCPDCAPKAKRRTKVVVVAALVAAVVSIPSLPLAVTLVITNGAGHPELVEPLLLLFGFAPFAAGSLLATEVLQTRHTPLQRHPKLVRITALAFALALLLSLVVAVSFAARR